MIADLLPEEVIDSEVNPLDKLEAIKVGFKEIIRGVYSELSESGFYRFNVDRIVDIVADTMLGELEREMRWMNHDTDYLNSLVLKYDEILYKLSRRAYEGSQEEID